MVKIPSSKSYTQRALICASLSQGESFIICDNFCDDVMAVAGCLNTLGAKIEKRENGFAVKGINFTKSKGKYIENALNFQSSGAAYRFILPVIGLLGLSAEYEMSSQLEGRPNEIYHRLLSSHGMKIGEKEISGKLKSGNFELPGNVSSQYVSGLLMALPLLEGESEIVLTTPLQSAPYVRMTAEVMNSFGVEVKQTENGYFIKGNCEYKPCEFEVEGDWSAGAYFICAGKEVTGLNENSLQGDKVITELLNENEINAGNIPDLVLPLTAYALTRPGTTKIYNASRLRYKETNRLETLCKALSAIGGDITVKDDGLLIKGKEMLDGGEADSCNDHRIAMALALASLKCKNPVTILNSDCVSKSFPSFFEKFEGNYIIR